MAATAGTFLCFALLWALLDRGAAWLGSTRGEYGLVVCVLVVLAALVCERLLSRESFRQCLAALGFRAPSLRALISTIALVGGLLLFFPLFSAITGARLSLHANALMLSIGIFAQGGIAEELVFRGFLYRHLRAGRSFWRAAWLAVIPFVAVHTLLFLTLDFSIALAATALALSMSFPLAWLFERAGYSLWPPAILHAVAQGAIKLIDASDGFPLMALGWMGLCATAPWLLFLLRPKAAQKALTS